MCVCSCACAFLKVTSEDLRDMNGGNSAKEFD